MLMVGVFVSKCPTSQLTGVRVGQTNKFYLFVLNHTYTCQKSQANTDTNTTTISLPQPLYVSCKNYLLLISFVNSTGSTILPSL